MPREELAYVFIPVDPEPPNPKGRAGQWCLSSCRETILEAEPRHLLFLEDVLQELEGCAHLKPAILARLEAAQPSPHPKLTRIDGHTSRHFPAGSVAPGLRLGLADPQPYVQRASGPQLELVTAAYCSQTAAYRGRSVDEAAELAAELGEILITGRIVEGTTYNQQLSRSLTAEQRFFLQDCCLPQKAVDEERRESRYADWGRLASLHYRLEYKPDWAAKRRATLERQIKAQAARRQMSSQEAESRQFVQTYELNKVALAASRLNAGYGFYESRDVNFNTSSRRQAIGQLQHELQLLALIYGPKAWRRLPEFQSLKQAWRKKGEATRVNFARRRSGHAGFLDWMDAEAKVRKGRAGGLHPRAASGFKLWG